MLYWKQQRICQRNSIKSGVAQVNKRTKYTVLVLSTFKSIAESWTLTKWHEGKKMPDLLTFEVLQNLCLKIPKGMSEMIIMYPRRIRMCNFERQMPSSALCSCYFKWFECVILSLMQIKCSKISSVHVSILRKEKVIQVQCDFMVSASKRTSGEMHCKSANMGLVLCGHLKRFSLATSFSFYVEWTQNVFDFDAKSSQKIWIHRFYTNIKRKIWVFGPIYISEVLLNCFQTFVYIDIQGIFHLHFVNRNWGKYITFLQTNV